MKIPNRMTDKAKVQLVCMCVALTLVFGYAWAQDETEVEPSTGGEVIDVVEGDPTPPQPQPDPVPPTEPEVPVEEPPGETGGTPVQTNMLTMLFVIIVSPIVTGFLRRFNVANSMYQAVNAVFSVALFVAWWYFFGHAEAAGLEAWIIQGLAAAGVSGSLMSVAGRKKDIVKEVRAFGTGDGKGS